MDITSRYFKDICGCVKSADMAMLDLKAELFSPAGCSSMRIRDHIREVERWLSHARGHSDDFDRHQTDPRFA